MSKTLFKIFTMAFLRDRTDRNLFQDCFMAVSQQVQQMIKKVMNQLNIIRDIVSEKPLMSIIDEEETDREDVNENMHGFTERVALMQKKFNNKIIQLKSIERNFEEIVAMYKHELKSMAHSLTQIKQKNKKLKNQYKIKQKQIQQLRQDKIELIQTQNIRKPPEPVSMKCNGCTNKQNIQKNQSKQIKISKQQIEDKHKWKDLAIKIDRLKKKIDSSENQINNKNKIIKQLEQKLEQRIQVRQSKELNHSNLQIRRLKTLNTNLRGQKITFESKLNQVQKQLSRKQQLCQTQGTQIGKMKIEMDNLSSTVKWQTNTIKDLKENMNITINNTMRKNQFHTKKHQLTIEQYRRMNQQLIITIDLHEQNLKKINIMLEKVQTNAYSEQIKLRNKINQMENILNEKNQCIIKLKSINKTDNMAYYNDLIRVLTKKISDRDLIINRLQNKCQ